MWGPWILFFLEVCSFHLFFVIAPPILAIRQEWNVIRCIHYYHCGERWYFIVSILCCLLWRVSLVVWDEQVVASIFQERLKNCTSAVKNPWYQVTHAMITCYINTNTFQSLVFSMIPLHRQRVNLNIQLRNLSWAFIDNWHYAKDKDKISWVGHKKWHTASITFFLTQKLLGGVYRVLANRKGPSYFPFVAVPPLQSFGFSHLHFTGWDTTCKVQNWIKDPLLTFPLEPNPDHIHLKYTIQIVGSSFVLTTLLNVI